MIKGLAITPPTLGRIAIGKVIEKNGKRLPQKDDQFTITTHIQTSDGWHLHPYDDALRKAQCGKIRSIPVTMLFNDPELNFRAQYTAFDRQTGRPLCVGDGESCCRVSGEGLQSLPCPGPQSCSFGQGGLCKPYGRLVVVIGEDDPVAGFVFRTTGFNSIRTLTARLQYFKALSGDRLACLPLELRLRGKSSTQSYGQPFYFVDLTLRAGINIEETLEIAREVEAKRRAAGFDQAALDAAARGCLANGTFDEGEDEGIAIVEEFYPDSTDAAPAALASETVKDKLAAKVSAKVALNQSAEVAG